MLGCGRVMKSIAVGTDSITARPYADSRCVQAGNAAIMPLHLQRFTCRCVKHAITASNEFPTPVQPQGEDEKEPPPRLHIKTVPHMGGINRVR